MKCYKCNETDPSQLSVKRRQRGQVLYVCRSCRRAAYTPHTKPREDYVHIDPKVWAQKAAESHKRILLKYS